MNTRLLMATSTVFLGAAGLAASFLPEEILRYAGSPAHAFEVLVVQIAGAAYLGFAILNWMARENLIGGIYSRPVAFGNFLHFTVVAFAVLNVLIGGETGVAAVVCGAAYTGLAVAFGLVLFTHPGTKRDATP